jgi:hypothetical protein
VPAEEKERDTEDPVPYEPPSEAVQRYGLCCTDDGVAEYVTLSPIATLWSETVQEAVGFEDGHWEFEGLPALQDPSQVTWPPFVMPQEFAEDSQ